MVYLPKDKMWDHYCPVEETEMSIGKDEECNWCGATEDSDWNARPECRFGDGNESSS
jgi:L,D-peptidoglycan transpeptidase YkuD (ErfK/YbiS/YcfS/YnhG family)